jgi:dTDP-L-rhamnose 4-epimerase
LSKYNVLVTGGAGFIGSHLVNALLANGHRVRVLDSLVEQVHGSNGREQFTSEAEFIHADVCDAHAVAKALEGIDVVYHEAAEVGVGQSMYEIARYVKANDLGTAVLLEEMIKRPGQFSKLLVASSMSIYGEGAYRCRDCGDITPDVRPTGQLLKREWEVNCPVCDSILEPIPTPEGKPLIPTSVYAISKQVQEQYCLVVGKAYDIPTTALRYFNVYGSGQALSNPYTGVCAIFSSRLLNDQAPLIFEDGLQSRDFVHVSDIVQANLLALESDDGNYEMFNIGSGTSITVSEVASLLARGLGKDIEPELIGRYREGDIRHCFADISKARQLLGYEPKVSLVDGIPELLEWVNKQTAVDEVAKATATLTSYNLVR